jgi:hypothetical protein
LCGCRRRAFAHDGAPQRPETIEQIEREAARALSGEEI